MPLVDNAWYINYGNGTSTGYYAVPQWTTGTKVAGTIIRQFTAPAVGSERCFVCVVAGAASGTEPASWGVTRGALTTDNAVTWQECTGIAALNGDATNTPTWTTVKNTAVVLGQVIKRNNGVSYQIATVAGTAGNGAEPSFSDTAGVVTNDGANLRWTSLGVVGNFTGWQAPHARLASAFTSTWGAAGNSFYIASNHAETQSTAITLTTPGTAASPCFIYCVTTATVPPPTGNLTTGASITTTGNSNLSFAGTSGYYYGITFNCGTGNVAPILSVAMSWGVLDTCALSMVATATTTMRCSAVILNNTTVQFGATGQSLAASGSRLVWQNTASAIQGATLPTSLITTTSAATIYLTGVDFSALGSGKTIISALSSPCLTYLTDCKLAASVTVAATPTVQSNKVFVVRTDSSGTNYQQQTYQYPGTLIPETTIVRTGGASDGTTPISWKITSTANSKWVFPFESFPITIWNTTIAPSTSPTVTIYGTINSASLPNNDDIWIVVEYLGSTLTPMASFANSTKANNLATGQPYTSDSTSAWGGGGAGAGWSPFKMSVTLSTPKPAMVGYIYVTVYVAKAITTYYIDPLIALS